MKEYNQLFQSDKFGVIRTSGTPDNPEFCLSDVCRALSLDSSQVVKRLDDEVVTIHPTVDALGRTQPNKYINESGLYDVIFESRKPEAKEFRKWVTSEVLPSIRKTGAYATAEVMEKALTDPDYAIRIFTEMKNLRQQKQLLEGKNRLLENENKEMAPKAEYAEKVLQSTDSITFRELAKELNMRSATELLNKLIKARIVYRAGDKYNGYRYLPYAKYSGLGFFDTRTYHFVHRDGTPGTSVGTVVTEKGRMFLHKQFNVALKPIDITMFNI